VGHLKTLPQHDSKPAFLSLLIRTFTEKRLRGRPLEDWGKLLSDVPTAGAILDRFLHHAIVISVTGRSYRVKDALIAPAARKSKPSTQPAGGQPALDEAQTANA